MALSMSGQLVREMNPEICYMGFSDFPLKLCKTKNLKKWAIFQKGNFHGKLLSSVNYACIHGSNIPLAFNWPLPF